MVVVFVVGITELAFIGLQLIRLDVGKKRRSFMKICLIGVFSGKRSEYAFVREQILTREHEELPVNSDTINHCTYSDIVITYCS
jgi:hypothetical protein